MVRRLPRRKLPVRFPRPGLSQEGWRSVSIAGRSSDQLRRQLRDPGDLGGFAKRPEQPSRLRRADEPLPAQHGRRGRRCLRGRLFRERQRRRCHAPLRRRLLSLQLDHDRPGQGGIRPGAAPNARSLPGFEGRRPLWQLRSGSRRHWETVDSRKSAGDRVELLSGRHQAGWRAFIPFLHERRRPVIWTGLLAVRDRRLDQRRRKNWRPILRDRRDAILKTSDEDAQGHHRTNSLAQEGTTSMYDATLKENCLGFVELLAQGIALISPTMTAALIIPVMYGNTGDWSWLSYALGTVMLVFVAFNLNQFARRYTTAGSMYLYICRGLGLTAGAIGGWSLIWAYLGISMAGVTGFSIFADKLLEMAGLHLPFALLFAACVGAAWFCAWKNVQLSAMLMLLLEGASMLLILILCLVTLAQHGFKIDHAQFDTSSLPLSGLGLGIVVAIFSLVGFECCTAFGEEARDPLVTIPKAVVWSLAISGGFFVIVSYVMVMATHGSDPTLDKMDAPLNYMASLAHVSILQAPLSFGAMVSFFALCLSCINAGSRVLFAMGRHGLFRSE